MMIRTQLMLPARAAFLALPLSGMATTVPAQTVKSPTSMPTHQGAMKAGSSMSGTMMGPHHAVAMA